MQARWFKIYIFAKSVFFSAFGFSNIAFLFLHTLLLCHILSFGCWIFSIPSRCQKVWIQIRPNILLGLIWVQTVCKGVGKELKYKKKLVDTFWLKPWLKLMSFGSNFFHLAKVLATTNFEPG